tara:strand:+ start:2363 stop:2725 length:363 start_codon:yes stop_codon:yes gene_type:complete
VKRKIIFFIKKECIWITIIKLLTLVQWPIPFKLENHNCGKWRRIYDVKKSELNTKSEPANKTINRRLIFSVLSAHFRVAKNIMGRGVLLFVKDRRFFSNEENERQKTLKKEQGNELPCLT